MRHQKKGKTLDRKKASREALLRNLATSVVLYEKVRTTRAKARAVQPIVERSLSLAKKGDLHARRQLLQYFYDKKAVQKLMEYLPSRLSKRSSGYTRVVSLGIRRGDAAEMVQLEILNEG